jgi:hypothetical protein
VAAAQKTKEDLAAAQRTAEIMTQQNSKKAHEAAITLEAEKVEKAKKADADTKAKADDDDAKKK